MGKPALVPKPRAHLTRYHGVFAPASPDRPRIVQFNPRCNQRAAIGQRSATGDDLVNRHRELVEGIADLGNDHAVTSEGVEMARSILRSLFGKIP